MARTPRLERLTASDLFLLLWDDYGWSSDIGGLAICDGTSLLDRDGRVLIEAVRARLEPRLHLVPRFRQLLYRPRPGLGWPLWVDAPRFDLADHIRVYPVAAPGGQAQLLAACQDWRPGGWIQPGRCGSCGFCPACQTGRWVRTCGYITSWLTARRHWPPSARSWTRPLAHPPRPYRRGRRSRSRPQASCWPTTCAAAGPS